MNEYTPLEERYLIQQRVPEQIEKHGSVENAIKHCEDELKWCDDNFSNYYYDCVGHAITCNSLLIPRLKDSLRCSTGANRT